MTEQQFNYLKGLNRQYSQNALENPTLKQFWNRKIAENHKNIDDKDHCQAYGFWTPSFQKKKKCKRFQRAIPDDYVDLMDAYYEGDY